MFRCIKMLGVTISVLLLCCNIYFFHISNKSAEEAAENSVSISLMGSGTESDPYIIDSYDTLKQFRDLVNDGESFSGKYILQTDNIDLKNEEWIPIGIFLSDNYFDGIYDGGGHYISNLYISSAYPFTPANVGFFGMLSGTVKNLGIESGHIEGEYIGSICSHGTNSSMILNCYNKATIAGIHRAGGITDNFGEGSVIGCVNFGEVTAPVTGTISYNAGLACAIYPETLPDTYQGIYYQGFSSADDMYAMLDRNLDELIRLGIIQRKDVTMWQE